MPGVFVAQRTASPRAVAPTTTSVTPMTSPSPSSAGARLTVAGARKAVASWVARHNATIKDRDLISKGIYAGFRSAAQAYGFRTEDGGAFYVFSLLNNPQSIWQVLTVGVSVPRNGRQIREIGGDWYA
ncbi:hypothetical protein [Nonomuraea sp. bgisy101]|uniref:hypothetical protein n=1 Tax=Nonomuraea sp. bgisy101 TaxID=3413784 RepID=UPI003D72A7F5